jgi:hypothetical protein
MGTANVEGEGPMSSRVDEPISGKLVDNPADGGCESHQSAIEIELGHGWELRPSNGEAECRKGNVQQGTESLRRSSFPVGHWTFIFPP